MRCGVTSQASKDIILTGSFIFIETLISWFIYTVLSFTPVFKVESSNFKVLGDRGYKTCFMLNSTEHEIDPAHKH